MSKYSCDIIQDLLALYHDGVCSNDSRTAVELHLSECEKCSSIAKQLNDATLESNISEQSCSVLKKHGKRQRRIITIIISVAILGIAAVLFFGVITPRIEINKLIDQYLPEVGEGAEYFTGYDVKDESLVKIETDSFDIGIPADYIQRELDTMDAVMYCGSANNDMSIYIPTPNTDMSNMDMFDRSQYENMSDKEYEITVNYLKEWIEALGHGLPDSSYGTYKCAYLLSDNDRSFWNIGQNIAFAIIGFIKDSLPMWGEGPYIYEADDKCGFVFVSIPKDDMEYYRVTVDMYSTDDLNTPHTVIIRSETLEDAYSIINSISFKERS